MTTSGQIEPVGERNGVPFYKVNPSIPLQGALEVRERGVQVARAGKAMLIAPDSGEVLGKGSLVYMEQEEVDQTKFVKLYLQGIRNIAGLTKTGLQVFELVYAQVQGQHGVDRVMLSAFDAKEQGLEDRTYRRGLRELQDKKLLFSTTVEGVFFINIRYLFNGDRLHFVKSYYRKASANESQMQLGLDG